MIAPELQAAAGYQFRDSRLLERALSHSSYANECKGESPGSNERLEFLGDSVLGFIAAEYFYHEHPGKPEGELTKIRASAVCETALCGYARKLRLGEALLLGRGERGAGGTDRSSILADAFEALLAAIYLDGGMDAARAFVLRFLREEQTVRPAVTDSKTLLQQIVQQNPEEAVDYVLIDESGPSHDKCFLVEVRLHSNVLGTGQGRSKKLAEQAAAAEALKLMGI
ncbi:MAG: ribonuclease III [Oscillospiraceae bacterium]|jgi:ribonuclease-3|nr:ribonuclease III [Oscillospiraceae bacterium]